MGSQGGFQRGLCQPNADGTHAGALPWELACNASLMEIRKVCAEISYLIRSYPVLPAQLCPHFDFSIRYLPCSLKWHAPIPSINCPLKRVVVGLQSLPISIHSFRAQLYCALIASNLI